VVGDELKRVMVDGQWWWAVRRRRVKMRMGARARAA
jgi:hypothetical protein